MDLLTRSSIVTYTNQIGPENFEASTGSHAVAIVPMFPRDRVDAAHCDASTTFRRVERCRRPDTRLGSNALKSSLP
jgi:hypothetical protein